MIRCKHMQRLFDIFFSFTVLIFLMPLLIIVSLILKATGEHEILYLQERIGKNGQPFNVLKFATMLKDSPKMGSGTITLKDDPRVLPAGKLLRKTKINELPQLFNVLKGDMSLVGPRPLTEETFSGYSSDEQKIITSVSPGLSGVGSIVFRDEESILQHLGGNRTAYFEVIAPYKAQLEIWFVQNLSIKIYFAIIFLTLAALVNANSKLVWVVLKGLPPLPEHLAAVINEEL